MVTHGDTEIRFSEGREVSIHPLVSPHVFVSMMASMTGNPSTFDKLVEGLKVAGIAFDDSVVQELDNDTYQGVEQSQLGTVMFRAVYPVYYALYPYESFNDGFYGFFAPVHESFVLAVQQKTLRDLIQVGFGYYRKDLVRAVTSVTSNVNRLSAAMLAAPYLPADWVVAFLNRKDGKRYDSSVGSHIEKSKNLDLLFRGMSRYDIRHILWGDDHYHLGDMCDMAEYADLEKISFPSKPTASMFHDLLVKASNGLLEEGIVFEVPALLSSLAVGTVINGVHGKPLERSSEYTAAGIYMDNCAGTAEYLIRAQAGDGCILLWDTGALETSVIAEFRQSGVGWVVHQIRHGHNIDVDLSISTSIRNHLNVLMEEVRT